MPPGAPSIGRFAALTGLFAAPAALVLLALAAAGRLGLGTAAAAAVVVAAATGAILWRYHRDAVRIGAWLARLGGPDDGRAHPPLTSTAAGRALVDAVSLLQRGWQERSLRLAGQVAEAASVLEALNDPVVVLDERRHVVHANRAARTLLGEHMIGQDLAGHLRHPAVLAAVDAVLAGGGARLVELTRPVPVEQVFEVRITRFAATGADAAAPGALAAFHDITAMKRSEQMRADFVANASHELRTPLSSLIGFIETLRGPARDDPAARDRFLGIMNDQAARMARLVADLLSLSRIELDEHTPPTGTVDPGRILRGVIAALDIKANARGLRIRLDAPAGLPPVAGDEDQLAQVFQNLIDNAVNYTRPGTEILVAAEAAEGGAGLRGPAVRIAVRDQGDGIDRIHLPRLTERFYRVDPARSRAVGGTGLGLAIVKHIVSRHRGRLLIDSTPGVGSTFTVILPASVH